MNNVRQTSVAHLPWRTVVSEEETETRVILSDPCRLSIQGLQYGYGFENRFFQFYQNRENYKNWLFFNFNF
jgi:hypothetical protein